MKWSITVGRFWGTELRLHASLLLLIPYTLIAFRPEDAIGAVRVMILIVAIFACVTLHEAGHTLAARLYGIEVKSITLWPLGGFASLSRRPEKTFPNIVIVAAGPLTNLILAAAFSILALAERLILRSLALPGFSSWSYDVQLFPFLVGLIIANLSLAVFNLIPIYPLDGGQIARDLLKLIFGEKRADQIMMFIGLPLAGLILFAGVITFDLGLLLTGVILVLASTSLNARALNGMTLSALFFMDRGGYHLKNENFDQAVEEFSRQIQRSPDKPGPYFNRGMAYLNLREYERAHADMARALQIDPNNVMALTLQGELYDLENRPGQAMACYDRAIALRPTWAIIYADRGTLHQKLGNLTEAKADLDQSVALGQGTAVTHILRSILLFDLDDRQGAASDAEKALRFAPHWMLVFNDVFLENFKGHKDWVLYYYNLAVERFPNAYQAFQGRADALQINGLYDWAVEDYHRAIRLAPNLSQLYINRGRAYCRLGQMELAAADFKHAIQLADKSHLRRQAEELLLKVSPHP